VQLGGAPNFSPDGTRSRHQVGAVDRLVVVEQPSA
jgi:hypothetical protein